MNNKIIFSLVLFFAINLFACAQKKKEKATGKEIQWHSYADIETINAKKKKKIFVDVYTDWCGWCKKMDASTMTDPKVIEYMNKKFYAVKLDAESSKIVTYRGKQMTERELAARIFKATGYPTTVYLDENENLLQPLSGYLDAPTLDKVLHFYGEDKFKSQSWEQFNSTYVSE